MRILRVRKWRLLTILVAIMLLPVALLYAFNAEAKHKREAGYQLALEKYSQNLKPGLTRRDVEAYFHTRHIAFNQMCCLTEQSVYADLVSLGQEEHPWYCSENTVIVAFEFAVTESHNSLLAADSDILTKVSLSRQLGGCL